MNQIIIDLLKKAHYYYPIGMPHIFNEYNGYYKLKEILKAKIDNISAQKNTKWSILVEDVKKHFPTYKVFDYGYLQFPNYILVIELCIHENNRIVITKSIILNISLLVNYYTIFFEDLIKLKGDADNSNGIKDTHFQMIYFNSCIEEECLENANQLKKIVAQFFNEHSFLEHRQLFENKVLGSKSYGNEFSSTNEASCLYELLFSNDQIPDRILE